MVEFEIGEKVKVVKQHGSDWPRPMNHCIGLEGTVETKDYRDYAGCYRYGVRTTNGDIWSYYSQSLEKVETQNKEMKIFKVGDKVTITRKATAEELGHTIWTDGMTEMIGKSGTITHHSDVYSVNKRYKIGGWWYPSAPLELEKEEVKSVFNPSELYLKLQLASGFEAGDTVRVKSKAESQQFGWANMWAKDMDNIVGQTRTILNADKASGILLDKEYKRFPFFVLEKVVEPKTIAIPLNREYSASIGKDSIVIDGKVLTKLELVRLLSAKKTVTSTIEVTLANLGYTAKVSAKGIEVGCQSFPLSVLDELEKANEKIND